MRTLRHLAAALVLVGSGALSGCADFGGSASVEYTTTAKGNYDRALEQMKRENWPEAIKLFQYVRSKFSFSKWATLSELGIADANFGREKYQDAVDGYHTFIKNHPTHDKVVDGYCDFRIGEAYYKEIPTEWFLVPPSYEKDQGPVRDAIRELAAFVSAYASSPYLERAKKMEEDCVRRLAEHEIYVADFYLRNDHPAAAVGRLEGLVKGSFLPKLSEESSSASNRLGTISREYLRRVLEPQVLLLLGRTQMKLNHPDLAKEAFERLIAAHPEDFHAKKARLYLDHLAQAQR